MQAWLFNGVDQPLQLINRPIPEPGPKQVLVAVEGSGLCHSDVGRMDGTLTPFMPKPPPIILGHEISGTILAVGEGANRFAIGDRVVASGTQHYCPGRNSDGGYATHCLLPEYCLLPLPATVSFVQGAAATDAGQTSHHAVAVVGQVTAGMRVGIIGLGGLGMTGARIAVLLGADVFAAELRAEAYPVAEQQGVKAIVEDAAQLAEFDLDVIIDFAGFGDTTAKAISAVRGGGCVVLVGLGKTESTIPTMALVAKSVALKGSGGGQPEDTQAVLNYMAQQQLAIQTTTVPFAQIPDGLARLQRGGVVGRIVATPQQSSARA